MRRSRNTPSIEFEYTLSETERKYGSMFATGKAKFYWVNIDKKKAKSIIGNVFSNLRVYAQVKNALTFTKYTGFDPEIAGGILNTGIDRGAYPQPRTYAVGLDIKL